MTSNQENIFLSGDFPLSCPDDDMLDYRPFAQHLAHALVKMAPQDGMVVALYGPWGSGKSTLLNFVEYYLNNEVVAEVLRPKVIRYNPWWFTGTDSLIMHFFSQMSSNLSPYENSKTKLQNLFSEFCDAVTMAPIPEIWKLPPRCLSKWTRPKAKDISTLKEKLVECLREERKRYIVMIDDIDRLTSEEIRQLFKVIKAVANLPNITYVLAFDKNVVASSLNDYGDGLGLSYLEKIVQTPFELPHPDKTLLAGLFLKSLDKVLVGWDESAFDSNYWNNLFIDGIVPHLRTPRDVARIVNTIAITSSAVVNEVNLADFITIEFLRVLHPDVYNTIRLHKDKFSGINKDGMTQSQKDLMKKFHEDYLDKLEQSLRSPIKTTILRLFPQVESVFTNIFYTYDHLPRWRRSLRICSPDIFPTYFRLQLPDGVLTAREVREFLEILSNRAELGSKLLELSKKIQSTGVSKARVMLQRIQDHTSDDVPIEKIPDTVLTLFDVGDELVKGNYDRAYMWDLGIETDIGRVIFQLLKRLPEQERFEIIKKAISEAKGLSTLMREMVVLEQQHGKYSANDHSIDEDPIVTSVHLKELEHCATKRIEIDAQGERLIQTPRIYEVLFLWKEWQPEKCQNWILEHKNDENFVLALVECAKSETFTQSLGFTGLGDRVAKRKEVINMKAISEILEPDSIKEIAKKILQNHDLTDRQRKALELFIVTESPKGVT